MPSCRKGGFDPVRLKLQATVSMEQNQHGLLDFFSLRVTDLHEVQTERFAEELDKRIRLSWQDLRGKET
ncbi:hypothetical protein Y1Q_0012494 [Alligator mississippiensis]|uniref:Uncharacterized protein n=1 Tax=Alligator mississippiensis TaxID=8496 RepID=A0A151M7W2_ALLMI|nr:hypothetical protein Y1Q_0012494 [Alligator mississippiensis]